MTSKNEEQYIKIAADSIHELRRVDVFRVIESLRADNIDGVTRNDLATFIAANRPDLQQEVTEVMSEPEFAGCGWSFDATTGQPQSRRVVFVVDYIDPEESQQDLSDLATWAEVSLMRSTIKVKVDVTAYASVQDAFADEKEQAGRRVDPDALTIAYLAIGARKLLGDSSFDLATFDGELGFIDIVTSHALFVDQVGDWFTSRSSHPGVCAYEVAESFGKAIGKAMLENADGQRRHREILREVLVKAHYAEQEVDQAIASVPQQ